MAAGQYLYQGMSDVGAGVAKRASRIEEQEKDLKRAKATLKFLEAGGHDTSGLQDVDSEGLNNIAELLMKGGEMKLRQDAINSEIAYRKAQMDEIDRKRKASESVANIISSKVPVQQDVYGNVIEFGSPQRPQYGFEKDIPLEVLSQAPQAQASATDVLAQPRNPLITPEISKLKTDKEKIEALSKSAMKQDLSNFMSKALNATDYINPVAWVDIGTEKIANKIKGEIANKKQEYENQAINALMEAGEIKSTKQDEVPELLARPQQTPTPIQKPVPQYNIRPDYATGANMLPKTQFKTTQAPVGKETVMINAVEAAGGLNNLIQSNPEVARAWATMDKDQREAFTDSLGGGSLKDQYALMEQINKAKASEYKVKEAELDVELKKQNIGEKDREAIKSILSAYNNAISSAISVGSVANTAKEINKLFEESILPAGGVVGSIIGKYVPITTNASDIVRLNSQITSDAAIGVLSSLRSQGTGSGLGATSNIEIQMLQNSLKTLDPSLSPDIYLRNLKEYVDIRYNTLNVVANDLASKGIPIPPELSSELKQESTWRNQGSGEQSFKTSVGNSVRRSN